VTADLNQHIPVYCGACWIHGGVSMLNDRIKIMRRGAFPDVMLSRQALMNCIPDASGQGPPPGCNGGDAWMIFKYMQENKVPDDSCMPYVGVNQECKAENICRNCFHNQTIDAQGHPFFTPGPCFGVPSFTGYSVGDYGNVKGEEAMMREIYARGPIACSAATDDTFVYNYTVNPGILAENVYTTDFNYTAEMIDHVMEVAGWGVTSSGTKYWVVRNSWGTYWGDMGWVKIRRGVNQMQIESDCGWAVPKFQDLDEQLHGQAMGDYIHGITVRQRSTGSSESAPQDSLAAATALSSSMTTQETLPSIAVAFIAGTVGMVGGVSAMHFAGGRRVARQPHLLG